MKNICKEEKKEENLTEMTHSLRPASCDEMKQDEMYIN